MHTSMSHRIALLAWIRELTKARMLTTASATRVTGGHSNPHGGRRRYSEHCGEGILLKVVVVEEQKGRSLESLGNRPSEPYPFPSCTSLCQTTTVSPAPMPCSSSLDVIPTPIPLYQSTLYDADRGTGIRPKWIRWSSVLIGRVSPSSFKGLMMF